VNLLLGIFADLFTIFIAVPVPATPADPPPSSRTSKKTNTAYYAAPSQLRDKKEIMKESFMRLRFCKSGDERTTLAPRANPAPSEDYTGVFLSHARVYVFAEEFDI
jgi:hypothetical protein